MPCEGEANMKGEDAEETPHSMLVNPGLDSVTPKECGCRLTGSGPAVAAADTLSTSDSHGTYSVPLETTSGSLWPLLAVSTLSHTRYRPSYAMPAAGVKTFEYSRVDEVFTNRLTSGLVTVQLAPSATNRADTLTAGAKFATHVRLKNDAAVMMTAADGAGQVAANT